MNTIDTSPETIPYHMLLHELDAHCQSLDIMKELLTEIAGKNTDKETAALIGHFQNQFILQCDNIDLLKHMVHAGISTLSAREHAFCEDPSEELIDDQFDYLNDQLYAVEKVVTKLQNDFSKFMASHN